MTQLTSLSLRSFIILHDVPTALPEIEDPSGAILTSSEIIFLQIILIIYLFVLPFTRLSLVTGDLPSVALHQLTALRRLEVTIKGKSFFELWNLVTRPLIPACLPRSLESLELNYPTQSSDFSLFTRLTRMAFSEVFILNFLGFFFFKPLQLVISADGFPTSLLALEIFMPGRTLYNIPTSVTCEHPFASPSLKLT